MNFNASAVLLLVGLFADILLYPKIGQRMGRRVHPKTTDVARVRLTAVETRTSPMFESPCLKASHEN